MLCDTDGDGIIESSALKARLPQLESILLEIPQIREADRGLIAEAWRVADASLGAIHYWLPDEILILSFLTPQTAEHRAFGHRSLPKELSAQLPPSVTLGAIPGTYYCGRLFLAAQTEAIAPGSSVLYTAHDEAAVGFLHIPRLPRFEGSWRQGWTPPPAEADELLQGLQSVVAEQLGAALRTFESELRTQLPHGEPLRVLLTGFGPFKTSTDEIVENPSALFLGNPKLHFLEDTLQIAFGPSGWFAGEPREVTFQLHLPYEVASSSLDIGVCAEGALPRPMTIRRTIFPASDATVVASSPQSIQAEMRRFRPHLVIGLGTGGGRGYRLGPWGCHLSPHFVCTVEPHAALLGSSTTEAEMVATPCALRANFALARAIAEGSNKTDIR